MATHLHAATLHAGLRRSVGRRLRRGRDRGFIGPLVLCIMLMVAATSLTVYQQTSATVVASRESRNFVLSEENVDRAAASAIEWLNRNATTAPPTSDQVAAGEGNTAQVPSQFTWKTQNNYAVNGVVSGGQVVTSGTGGTTNESTQRAWRQRHVGSWQVDPASPNEYIYGVAAPGAWLAAVSTQDRSYVDGQVNGDWFNLGKRTILANPGSTYRRVISYNDDGVLDNDSGTDIPFIRSTFTATHDERLLNERVNACPRNLQRFKPSDSFSDQSFSAGTGPRCYYSVNIDRPVSVVGTGVATIVSYGSVVIREPINLAPGTQLHIYTPNGSVRFSRSGGGNVPVGTATTPVFIYGPNALCRTYQDTTITMFGSLACRATELDGSVSWATPLAEGNFIGRATQIVRYLEAPDYRDQFGS